MEQSLAFSGTTRLSFRVTDFLLGRENFATWFANIDMENKNKNVIAAKHIHPTNCHPPTHCCLGRVDIERNTGQHGIQSAIRALNQLPQEDLWHDKKTLWA